MNYTIDPINATANETVNQSGYWVPFEKGSIPNVNEIVLKIETRFVEMIASWGLDPIHTLFQLLVGVGIILLLYILFVKSTSGASNIFKPIFYIAIAILILILLGVGQ